MKTTISIIDDNASLLTSLSISLRLYGFRIITFSCPVKALSHHSTKPADFYIIDMGLPKMNGIEFYSALCKKFDKKSVPALFLTAIDHYEAQCLKKTSIGDYITKPFNTEGLVARIERILKKSPNNFNKSILQLGNLKMDDEKMQCIWFSNQIILTKKEYKILKILVKHPRTIFSREQLLDRCYDNYNVCDRVIDSQIKRLRLKFRKVHPKETKFDRIHTRYSIGYSWVPQTIGL